MTALKWVLIVMFALDVLSAVWWDAKTLQRTTEYRVFLGVLSTAMGAWILAVL